MKGYEEPRFQRRHNQIAGKLINFITTKLYVKIYDGLEITRVWLHCNRIGNPHLRDFPCYSKLSLRMEF